MIPRALAAELRALVPAGASVSDAVTEIIARVRASGDDALRYYTRKFDTDGGQPSALEVPAPELDTAAERLSDDVRTGLEMAIANVRRVCEAALNADRTVSFDGHEVTIREAPVRRAAVYVPGGRAPYPSTVVMGTVCARVAGVTEIAVCSPPGPDGEVDSGVLGACRLAGASVVYRMGGAHAIAALAFGTETVAPVDVIVGPGNLYVQEAKRQVFGQVGIDGFAGPSDLVLIAADGDPAVLALDLLAQAEHGAGSLVVAVSDNPELLRALERAHGRGPRDRSRGPTGCGAGYGGGRRDRPGLRPRASAAGRRRRRGALRPGDHARARSSSGRPAARPSGTTSRAPTTCCRPEGRDVSPRR